MLSSFFIIASAFYGNLIATCRSSWSVRFSEQETILWAISMRCRTLDGTRCLLEWKTTTARYPEEPNGLAGLGSSADLTSFLDQWYFRGGRSGFRSEARLRDSISQGLDGDEQRQDYSVL